MRIAGPDHPETLNTRLLLAWTHRTSGNHLLSIRLNEALVRDRIRIQGPDHPAVFTARSILATDRGFAGLHRRAVADREQLATDSARVHGPEHPDRFLERSLLAQEVRETGELDRAGDLLARLVTDRTRSQGPDHPSTLDERAELAYIRRLAGRHHQEVAESQALVADHERVHGPDHPAALTARSNLAHALRHGWRHHRAQVMYQSVLADRGRVLGADHPDTLDVRDSIARNLFDAGRHAEAAAYYHDALALAGEALGPEHSTVRELRRDLGKALILSGALDAAVAELSPMADDWDGPSGPGLPDLVHAGCVLAYALHLTGEQQAALRLVGGLATTATAALGGPDEATVTARTSHALLLAEGTRPLRAVVRLEELAETCAESAGPRSRPTLDVRRSLAHARLRAGDADGAVQVYERIIADRTTVGYASPTAVLLAGHADAHDVAVSIGAQRPGPLPVFPSLAVGLAHALVAAGRRDAARELLAAVCTGREALMDPGHPLAAEARTALARLDRTAPETEPEQERPPKPPAAAGAQLGRTPAAPLPGSAPRPPRRAARPIQLRPAWRPRLTLLEEPAVGATTDLELRLLPAGGATRINYGYLPRLRLVLAVAGDAVLDPPVMDYDPGREPARFTLTPSAPGPYTLRITVLHRGHGHVLQDLSVVIDVPAAEPPAGPRATQDQE